MLERIKKFGELSRNEQLLFSEALFLQVYIGLLLKIIPFRWIPRLFSGRVQGIRNPEPKPRQNRVRRRQTRNPEQGTPEQIKAAIQRSSPYSPWKNKCLVSSLAARRMLNRQKIPSQLSLGVARGANGKMIAHAWIKVDDFEIVDKGGDFSELYLF